MTYLLRTRLSNEASTDDLATPELFANLVAAYTTVDVLLEQVDVETLDSAYRFNAHCWTGHTLSLLNYADHMADEYVERLEVPPAEADWVRNLKNDRAHLLFALGDEGTESMLVPRWVHYVDVVQAHRAYLMWLKPEPYRALFLRDVAYLTPVPLPIPVTGLHLYENR